MHYPIYIFTKEFPSDQVIENVLKPYKDDADLSLYDSPLVRPDIHWDWFDIGGRYGGLLKIKCDLDDEYYQWMMMGGEKKAGRLFRSRFLETYSGPFRDHLFSSDEVYAFLYCGYRDRYIYADGAKISDLVNYTDLTHKGYAFIDPAYNEARSREYYINGEFVENEQYDDQLAAAMERNKDGYLTVVDIHD